mgnify:FL=1
MAKRNAVVVTHTRLRQTGTVVAEAVSQLRVAGFEVAIIDNTEAPDFGVQRRACRTTPKSSWFWAATARYCAPPNSSTAPKCRFSA